MSWNNQNSEHNGIQERGFELTVADHKVPGVYWCPEGGADRLVLLGHGGTTHKKIDYIVDMAQRLGRAGIASFAIDGPGHGERATSDLGASQDAFAEAWASEGGTATVISDWSAALDFIEAEEGARPTGWWGLSMGTMMGLPVTASDDRIRVALLGLMGTWGPNANELRELAPNVQCPVRWLVQWDDEIVPRDACIELFGLLGTKKKTMHVNPGKHQAVPVFEIDGSVEYLAKYLN